MLDTIALTLDQHQFEILDPERFSPSARGLLVPPYYPLGARGNFSCVQNPTKADAEAGRYLPRLTLSKRKVVGAFALTLRVEFSAPKLTFGNNFDELRSRDFEHVLDVLKRSLQTMAVRVSIDTLRAARVSAVHYGKNIAFTDYTTCSMVMQELALIDLDRRLDLSQTDYRNDGHAIRYHANSYEVTFYDKLKDLQMSRLSERRAIERDYGVQRDLFTVGGSFPKELEVLRMEVRLGNRTKIKQMMRQIGAELEPTFAALFDVSIAKGVVLHFWSNVRKQLFLVGEAQTRRPEDIFAALAETAEACRRPGKLLQQLGCIWLVGSIGFRGVGAIMGRHCSARSWQRYKKELKSMPLEGARGFSALRQVECALDRFSALRMASFQITPTQGSVIEPASRRPSQQEAVEP